MVLLLSPSCCILGGSTGVQQPQREVAVVVRVNLGHMATQGKCFCSHQQRHPDSVATPRDLPSRMTSHINGVNLRYNMDLSSKVCDVALLRYIDSGILILGAISAS